MTCGAAYTTGNATPATLPGGLQDAVAGSSQPTAATGSRIDESHVEITQVAEPQAASPGCLVASETPGQHPPVQLPVQQSPSQVSCTVSLIHTLGLQFCKHA